MSQTKNHLPTPALFTPKPIMASLLAASALLTGSPVFADENQIATKYLDAMMIVKADPIQIPAIYKFGSGAFTEVGKIGDSSALTPQQVAAAGLAATVDITVEDAKTSTPLEGGSGFFIDNQGDLSTCAHVVTVPTDQKNPPKGAHKKAAPVQHVKIIVTLPGGKKYTAKIIYKDAAKDKDIAFLHINIRGNKYLTLGDSSKAVAADPVLVIGNPFTLGMVVTSGIVSAPVGTITALPGELLRYDASSNPGSSGGPMLEVSSGHVIAMSRAIFSIAGQSAGVSFGTPSNVIFNAMPADIKAKVRAAYSSAPERKAVLPTPKPTFHLN